MITALLALIVYTINHNIYDVNYIMTAFISTLVLTRILLVKVQLSPSFQVILGSFLFTFGCLFLKIFSDCFAMVFIGALLFGMAIGFIAPVYVTANQETEILRPGAGSRSPAAKTEPRKEPHGRIVSRNFY